jgi:CO dehydrogenase maturation factor
MSCVIAIAGKGGTGKTTVASLIIRMIKEKKKGSVLAVDADPNSNLAESLGVQIKETIGSILEAISASPQEIPAGMSKDRYIDYRLQVAITEAQGFDLLAMGRSEGPGCYCYVNNVLRNTVEKIITDYDYVVIDNEAGFEHLSRRTTRRADILAVISDYSPAGLRAADRINELVNELDIKVKRRFLIINRCGPEVGERILRKTGLEYAGCIPDDAQISQLSLKGDSLMKLKNNAPSLKALYNIADGILL